MKIAFYGAVLITLPALVALAYALWKGNHWLAVAATVSLCYNAIPFLVLGIMSRKAKITDEVSH